MDRRIERGVRAGPEQVQGYTPAGNNERNQCCTAPLRRQSNGRRVRATTPLAPIAFCRPLVSATATTEIGRGKSYRKRERQRGGGGVHSRKYRDGTEAMNPTEKRGGMLREGTQRGEKCAALHTECGKFLPNTLAVATRALREREGGMRSVRDLISGVC